MHVLKNKSKTINYNLVPYYNKLLFIFKVYNHQISYNFNYISFLLAANSWGCQYTSNILNITCQQHQHIYILKSVLRRSYRSCRTKGTCCSTVCTMYGSLQRVQQLKNSCDGQQQCQVTVTKEYCSDKYYYSGYTDNESVGYFCINTVSGKLACYIKIQTQLCECARVCACACTLKTAMWEVKENEEDLDQVT